MNDEIRLLELLTIKDQVPVTKRFRGFGSPSVTKTCELMAGNFERSSDTTDQNYDNSARLWHYLEYFPFVFHLAWSNDVELVFLKTTTYSFQNEQRNEQHTNASLACFTDNFFHEKIWNKMSLAGGKAIKY